MQISLYFAGNYDARWLPKIFAIASKSSWGSFSSVIYRTKANLIDTEVALLRQFHDAGWTAYTRLAASGNEDPNARDFSLLQGGSILTVFVAPSADSPEELAIQTSVSVSNKSLPIPPDAGWIEFDNSTDLQTGHQYQDGFDAHGSVLRRSNGCRGLAGPRHGKASQRRQRVSALHPGTAGHLDSSLDTTQRGNAHRRRRCCAIVMAASKASQSEKTDGQAWHSGGRLRRAHRRDVREIRHRRASDPV